MGLIPRPFLDELLNQTDIVSFIDDYVPLKKQGMSFVACCPFHQEKTPSFNVIPKKQFYHCFGCGVSGNAISFAMNYLNQNFSDAVETLATRMGLQVPREGESSQPNALNQYQLLARVAKFYQKNLLTSSIAMDYLKQRGIEGEVLEIYHVGYAPAGWHTLNTGSFAQHQADLLATGMLIQKESGGTYDRYRHRITFPIHDRRGRIIGFGGRTLDDTQKPKYLNSPETTLFQKNRELYGLYQTLQQEAHPACILVVEGYLDVIALAKAGIRYAVAALGTATSTYHVQLLAKHTSRIVFCFDGDTAGRQAAWRALENTLAALNTTLDATFIFLPQDHDPDSFIRQEGKTAFLEKLETAMPLHQFFFETLQQDIALSSIAGKNQLLHITKPYIQKIPEGPYKQLLLNELSRRTHIELHRIQQLFEDQTSLVAPSTSVIKKTPIRLTSALILQYPDIYASLIAQFPPSLIQSEPHGILQKLMQQIMSQPSITTASLVELFRDTPWFDALTKLATWDHQISPDALKKELTDNLHFLARKNDEDEIQMLLQQARQQSLSESQRLKLQVMLQKRHRHTSD